MARPKRQGPRRRPDAIERLTWPQAQELAVGPHRRGSAFRDDSQRREAWRRHGDAREHPWAAARYGPEDA